MLKLKKKKKGPYGRTDGLAKSIGLHFSVLSSPLLIITGCGECWWGYKKAHTHWVQLTEEDVWDVKSKYDLVYNSKRKVALPRVYEVK